MNAVVLIALCVGNIIGPLTFRGPDKPEYVPAKITVIAACVWAIATTTVMRLYYKWESKKRDACQGTEDAEGTEFLDLTDKENKNFRYVY